MVDFKLYLLYSNSWCKHLLIHFQYIIHYLGCSVVILDWKERLMSLHVSLCESIQIPYLPLGESRRELDNETTLLDWFDSFCASRNSLKYSSPDENGSGVTRSGVLGIVLVAAGITSIHDSAEKMDNFN